jgi:hypothetical protein
LTFSVDYAKIAHNMNSSQINNDHHPTQGGGFDSFRERLEKKLAPSKTALDELRDLHATGTREAFDVFVDDLVYEALGSNDEFMNNVQTINRLRRLPGDHTEEESAIKDRQNELFNQYRADIIDLAGLPTEAGQDEYVVAKAVIQEKISEIVAKNGSSSDLLQELGIISLDEEGEEIFTYPRGLFPHATDKKWDLYLERVKDHLRKERGTNVGTIDRSEYAIADQMRKLAHDSVTNDVHSLLQLNKLPDESWGFAQTRRMMAKMRDSRYPTVETAEKDKTTSRVLEASQVLGVLGTRLSDLNKQ